MDRRGIQGTKFHPLGNRFGVLYLRWVDPSMPSAPTGNSRRDAAAFVRHMAHRPSSPNCDQFAVHEIRSGPSNVPFDWMALEVIYRGSRSRIVANGLSGQEVVSWIYVLTAGEI